MNALRTILLLLAMLPAFAMGQPFTIPQYDLSIDLPTGWIHDEEDQFGFVLYDPKSPGKKRKIRVHYPPGKASSPQEQAQITFELINNGRKEQGQPLERIQYEIRGVRHKFLTFNHAKHAFKSIKNKKFASHFDALGLAELPQCHRSEVLMPTRTSAFRPRSFLRVLVSP